MNINYTFTPEYKSTEKKYKNDVISYAGKLLEITGSETCIVSIDDEGRPFVLECPHPLRNTIDFSMDEY